MINDIGPFFVTTTTYRHLMLHDKESGRHQNFPGLMILHTEEGAPAFHFLVDSMYLWAICKRKLQGAERASNLREAKAPKLDKADDQPGYSFRSGSPEVVKSLTKLKIFFCRVR